MPVETKGQLTRWLHAQQQGQISCEVVVKTTTCVEDAPTTSQKLLYASAYVANSTVHHWTTNVPKNQVSKRVMQKYDEFS